jgi:hypothetical protein
MSEQVDIAVVGAGAAGIAAAISSARAGCRTLLLDQRPAPGGTGGFSGLTTLCGLYDDTGRFLNDGFTREFAEAITETAPLRMGKVWILPYRPKTFCAVTACLLSHEPNLQTLWNTPAVKVSMGSDGIVGINDFAVRAVIDCSGSAEVARASGAECLATDDATQASAVLFPLRHVSRKIETPADMAAVLMPLARAGFPPLSFQSNLEANTLTAKFSGPPEQVEAVIECLRAHVAGFEHCDTPLKRFVAVARAGRMIRGQHVLTGAEVLAGQIFPDAVARCAWPVEQWNAAGVVRLQYLPAGRHYEIPARSLRAMRHANLFMAGKTLSADVEAVASARVMGCCLATGAAAGKLAAAYLQSTGTT